MKKIIFWLITFSGAVGTGVLAYKAKPKFEELRAEAEHDLLTETETLFHVAKAYISTIVLGLLTIAGLLAKIATGIMKGGKNNA